MNAALQSPPAAPARPGFLVPAASLARRELVRFLRQRNRVVGALLTPVVFWLLIGGGMGRSMPVQGPSGQPIDYMQFFFPGTVLMILLFTAIFSTISIIEDRREGFLQSVLVAPVSRGAVVLGKVLGGTALAAGQGLLFLAVAPLVGVRFTAGGFLLCVALMLLVSFALTSLGVCIAWRMSSTQGFHAVMNLFLMPMWFLSGALFPAAGAAAALKWVMAANPLTYSLAALRRTMNQAQPADPSLAVGLLVTLAFAALTYLLASRIAAARTDADLV